MIPKPPSKRTHDNFITVQITCLTANGKMCTFYRRYEEWIGVCTGNIRRVVRKMKVCFPGCRVRYERLGNKLYKKVLPYFEERLITGKLHYAAKPFYKLYVDACLEDVGQFFDRYKIAYYETADWLVRIGIDLCARYDSRSFYYKWYKVSKKSAHLLESFRMIPERTDSPDMIPERTDSPDWTVAAFDLETVPLSGENRVPTGSDPKDSIVMISVVKWNKTSVERHLLYLTPCPKTPPLQPNPIDYDTQRIEYASVQYDTERQLLKGFHDLVGDAHVLTGYNIGQFDFPCLFARLFWLKMKDVLKDYSSRTIGDDIVTTFRNKIVIDMYKYFRIFSNYDLPGFKLDDVAKAKLGRTKIPIQSTGIHSWYVSENVTRPLLDSDDVKECYELLKPNRLKVDSFGTFKMFLAYCVIDSELVRQLFEKETALHFLIERGNLNGMDVGKALHVGNSNYLKELMKTMGTFLGYFVNVNFFENQTDGQKLNPMFVNGTYQGALNYVKRRDYFKNVVVMDFTSMYPCSLLSANLCYGTCTVLTREEYANSPNARSLAAIPFRNHSEEDFEKNTNGSDCEEFFRYPAFDPERDEFVIVVNQNDEAFLPRLVSYFLNVRKYHQRKYKRSKDVYHYNSQLNIKILINSLYGIMASKDSCLAKLDIAVAIVTLARYQLLGCYHKVTRDGYEVVYADTDSLMVKDYPVDDCDALNAFLSRLQHVEIKFEERFERLLVLSKKKYVFERRSGEWIAKGFQKKVNDLVKFMTDNILKHVMNTDADSDPNEGWIIWVETLLEAKYRCRDPRKYAISRKTKSLSEYKSTTCATVKMLQKYPEKAGEFIEYTYSRADVSVKEATKWIMDVDDVEYLDFQQLFRNQQKNWIDLLNVKFWKMSNPYEACRKVLNAMTWKSFVHAELLYYFRTGERVMLLVEKGVKYTFEINDHVLNQKRRKVVVK
ncbi:hypothetical protein AVEN_112021-1 [Araneus ventricosus]|uniref:DNA polymerase n=1 Tax=Araneus ventricosus TaxID=182803 RepID=A0A4Y2QQC2_ARAVE|nr:hypothetical protein AVEN_112021-1 [Araneus ventricosus]